VGSYTYTKTITAKSVLLWGPYNNTLNWGTGSTFFISELYGTPMTLVPNTTYSWWGDEGILSVSGNGGSNSNTATVLAPSGGGNATDYVNCAVTLNGITDYFQQKITIK